MKNEKKLTLDFQKKSDISLFTGPKNGKKFKKEMGVFNFETLIIKVKENQVITSSFYYGLIGDEFKKLFKKLGLKNDGISLEKIKENLDYSNLSGINKSEFERFLRRCILNF